jgi:hypothetical protein
VGSENAKPTRAGRAEHTRKSTSSLSLPSYGRCRRPHQLPLPARFQAPWSNQFGFHFSLFSRPCASLPPPPSACGRRSKRALVNPIFNVPVTIVTPRRPPRPTTRASSSSLALPCFACQNPTRPLLVSLPSPLFSQPERSERRSAPEPPLQKPDLRARAGSAMPGNTGARGSGRRVV